MIKENNQAEVIECRYVDKQIDNRSVTSKVRLD